MVQFYDVTLRDGNHAARHTIDLDFVSDYCSIADSSGVWAVEVGHGNGLGASSFLVGKSSLADKDMLQAARQTLSMSKLAVHLIPGFATIKKDIAPAVEIGVDVFRVGTHVTEVNTAPKHISFIVESGRSCQGVMMMSHCVDVATLRRQAQELESYGADTVVIMDSAGHYLPQDVRDRVRALKESIGIAVGFHAHNNLGMGVANALVAIEEGADLIDGSSMGLGAGSGNASLEATVVNFQRNSQGGLDIGRLLEMSQLVESRYPEFLPRTTSVSIQSGNAGVFSGFAPHVRQVANEFGLTQEDLWLELGRRKLVAGQESMIREVAQDLRNL
jgi:4-hydroxy 2-oxovalerate aldolase